MSPSFPTLLALWLLAAPPALDAELAAPRQALVTAQRARDEKVASRDARKHELEVLAKRIEELKLRQRNRLVTGGELDGALRRSQELSTELGASEREVAAAQASVQRASSALVTALTARIDAVTQAWERTGDREEKTRQMETLRALKAEREALREQLPAEAPLRLVETSDDPVKLKQQADALRDSEDKVRRRIRELTERLETARADIELDRRMNEFLGDEALFNEKDRRVRRSQSSARPEALLDRAAGPDIQAEATTTGPPGNLGGSPTAPGGPSSPQGSPTPTSPPALAPTHAESPSSAQTARTDRPFQTERMSEVGTGLRAVGDDVKSLEVELKRLEGIAQDLGRRAAEAEKRANPIR
jgi:hypothetical protein